MLSTRPRVTELAFQVFGRSLHPELYSVHQTRDVDRDHYQAKIEITDCGHVIKWVVGRTVLCEVASSASQPLPNRRRLMHHKPKSPTTDRVQHHDATYRTSFQLETVQPEMFLLVQQQLNKQPVEGLLYRFENNGRVQMGAISYVSLLLRSKSMLIQGEQRFDF
ncbi:MAG: DUF2617 domain-containing protein [Planctomycetota bacterium]